MTAEDKIHKVRCLTCAHFISEENSECDICREITIPRREKILRLSKQGFTGVQIANQLNVNLKLVYKDKIALGIAKTIRRITKEEAAAMVEMLKDGAPYSEVGATFGFHEATICAKFPGYGLSKNEIPQYRKMIAQFKEFESRPFVPLGVFRRG